MNHISNRGARLPLRAVLFSSLLAGSLFAPISGRAQSPTLDQPLPDVVRPTVDHLTRYTDLFRPARTDRATLSPDGHYVAFSLREGDQLSVVIAATDQLDAAITKISVVNDRLATPRFARHDEDVPAAINWMQWVTSDELVIETNAQVATGAEGSLPGVILAVSANGQNGRVLLTGHDVPSQLLQTGGPLPVSSEPVDFEDFTGNIPQPVLEQTTATIRNGRDYSMLGPTADSTALSAQGSDVVRAFERAENPSVNGSLFGSGAGLSTFANQDADVIDPQTGLGIRAQIPSVFDLNPQKPGHVLVRTNGRDYISIWDLDPATSKPRLQKRHPVDEEHLFLLDRQGRPRIAAPSSTSTAFPHRLKLENTAGARPKKTLATMAELPADAFDISPDNYFGHRALPIGFAEDPDILYYASNIGRDTYGIYALNVATGKRTDFAMDHPSVDLIPRPTDAFLPGGTLIFDRFTRAFKGVRFTDRRNSALWVDPLLQSLQSQLERSLPGKSVDILEWDQSGQKLLLSAGSPTSPGAFFMFDRGTGQLVEFAQRTPWLNELSTNKVITFTVEGAGHHEISCQLTLPKNPRVLPAPVIMISPSEPWDRALLEFQPEVQALARMGFAVVQITARSAWGHGVAARQSVHDGYDDAQIDDLIAVIDGMGQAFNVDPKRVGIIGSSWGGYVALRAMALYPDRFRCGVMLEPPIDLRKWLKREDWKSRDTGMQLVRSAYGPPELFDAQQLLAEADRITQPALLLSYPGPDGEARRDLYTDARRFVGSIKDTSPYSEFMDLSHDFAKGLPIAKSKTYREIELFLNTHVYNFGVEIGESVEVPEEN